MGMGMGMGKSHFRNNWSRVVIYLVGWGGYMGCMDHEYYFYR